MTFGARLSGERKKRNLSAEVLATACGVSRSYITLIENDKRLPGAKVLPKIASALAISPSTILNWYLEDMRERLQKSMDSSGS